MQSKSENSDVSSKQDEIFFVVTEKRILEVLNFCKWSDTQIRPEFLLVDLQEFFLQI